MTRKIITGKKREDKIYETCGRFYRNEINSTQFFYLLSEMNCSPDEAVEITRKVEINKTFIVFVECCVVLAIVVLFSLGMLIQ